jgi:hypothetical protein
MGDIKSPRVIWVKGVLFLLLGLLASALLVLQMPDIKSLLLHCMAVWAFCRCYYFAFYVIQHYVDSDFRYAGLFSFLQYALRRRRQE